MYIPEGNICRVEDLKLDITHANGDTCLLREDYAQITLIVFYPHQELCDLKMGGSYWALFASELKNHRDKNNTSFWKQGFEILQNIEDRIIIDKSSKRATDRVTNNTE